MRYEDQGILIKTSSFGEQGMIAFFLTQEHGYTRGMLTKTQKLRGYLDPGSMGKLQWQGRLEEHLGRWTYDPSSSVLAHTLHRQSSLKLLLAACALVDSLLAPHEAHPLVYHSFCQFLSHLGQESECAAYLLFECDVIRETGLNLDFEKCAVTNQTEQLTHVSPKTGRAVCKEQAAPYLSRLIELPDFLKTQQLSPLPSPQEMRQAASLCTYFLEHFVLTPHHQKFPVIRGEALSDVLFS